jgi:LacI family transcriptional regulator
MFANLGLVVDERWLEFKKMEWFETALTTMRDTSLRLGYNLEIFYLEKDLKTTKDPDRLLYARGIRGLVILSLFGDNLDLSLDWDRYAVVAHGHYSNEHTFHHIGDNAFVSIGIVCARLVGMGYKRIGLAHDQTIERRQHHQWIGGLAKEALLRPRQLKVVPAHLPVSFGRKDYLNWFRRYKPECILSNDSRCYDYLKEVGIRIPEEAGIVLLSPTAHERKFSGLTYDYKMLSAACIEQLHSFLLRGETGIPELRHETLFSARWSDGDTLRKQK